MLFNNARKHFLFISKYLGLFHVAYFLYRKRLRILCYHGFSYSDEHEFRPSLFVQPATLEKRLRWISNSGFTVIPLEEGVKLLQENRVPARSLVITIDDGFRSTLEIAAPILDKYKMPATVYVTTYYAEKEVPIFRLLILYIAWKEGRQKTADKLCNLLNQDKTTDLMQAVEIAENEYSEPERVMISKELARQLGTDYETIASAGIMSLMTEEELRSLLERGFDVQLHTHRHRLPLSESEVNQEIRDNRAVLEPIVGKKLTHFCYPSGLWNPVHLKPLAKLDVQSATTCEVGMNSWRANLLTLKRIFDRDDLEQIEFEAELWGFKELLRHIKKSIYWRQDRAEIH